MSMPSTRMRTEGLAALLLCAVAIAEQQCGGGAPVPALRFGAAADYALADRICCHNHRYAEPAGYQQLSHVSLFGGARLDENGDNTFYDSVCGKPLFVAPRGRSFAEWRAESLAHGWPSFRPEEVLWENVVIHDGGRMSSSCGTHLGHNLPSGGADRYCIDLVCVAGTPAGGVAFNSSDWRSDAPQHSGKEPADMTVALLAVLGAALALFLLFSVTRTWRRVRKTTAAPSRLGAGPQLGRQLVERGAGAGAAEAAI